jgi:hypothetical protein
MPNWHFKFTCRPSQGQEACGYPVTSCNRKRTFVQLRRLMDSNRDLARRIEAMETRYDEQFSQVFDAIKQLIAEDKTRKAKPPIGFL